MRPFVWLVVASCAGFAGCTHDFDTFQADAPAGDGGGPDAAAVDGGDPDVAPPGDAGEDASSDAQPDGSGACTEKGAMTFAGHCYFPLMNKQTWAAAGSSCGAASAHLVTLGSADEQDAVKEIVSADDRWIGLNRPASSPVGDASFAWATGEPRTYTDWGAGEPNGTGECARMKGKSGQWADATCTSMLRTICERD